MKLNPGPLPPSGPDTALPADMEAGPSIFSAIQDQLGLKLKPDESLDEFFIIDSVKSLLRIDR